ncbi:MAG: VOC family protein [Acidimicrobiales bacterium]
MTKPADRPFQVLGVQQIAIGGPDLSPMRHLWGDLLGIAKVGEYRSETENVIEDILQVGSGVGVVEIDLMQPVDPEASPKVDRTPLNHIGLWIDDLPAAVTWLTANGVRFTPGGIRPGAAGHDICFVHPKGNDEFPNSGQGVLIELVQAPADLIATLAAE